MSRVKHVRGPVVALPPHPQGTGSLDGLSGVVRTGRPTAADLFCGAGGLGLGLAEAGFDVVLGVDVDEAAVATHRAHFPGVSMCADLSDPAVIRRVGDALRDAQIDVVAGGPPCQPFSRAGRSKIRSLVETGQRPAHDERRELWRSFVEIVEIARPRAVLVENVPDMALSDDMLVVRSLTMLLEQAGYDVHSRLLDAWRHGVPQHRQRLILVALRDGQPFTWPSETETVTVRDAIGDLPPVEGGFRHDEGADGSHTYRRSRSTEFQVSARSWGGDEMSTRVHDHITRPVREDDRRAFEVMTPDTRYSDLPDHLKRYREDIFTDKYKRLDAQGLSRTITAHIARDGYWYIHPEQPRTLTIREAARLQTFPDRYRFAGPPSEAFRQIGNAVPPALGAAVGQALRLALDRPATPMRLVRSQTAGALAAWWRDLPHRSRPWLAPGTTLVNAVVGEVLLDRASARAIRANWPILRPHRTAAAVLEEWGVMDRVARDLGREDRLPILRGACEHLRIHGEPSDAAALADVPGPTSASRSRIVLAVLDDNPIASSAPVTRVASRVLGLEIGKRQRSHGRMAIAKLVGADDTANDAHLALMELGSTICLASNPRCGACPVRALCADPSAESRPEQPTLNVV